MVAQCAVVFAPHLSHLSQQQQQSMDWIVCVPILSMICLHFISFYYYCIKFMFFFIYIQLVYRPTDGPIGRPFRTVPNKELLFTSGCLFVHTQNRYVRVCFHYHNQCMLLFANRLNVFISETRKISPLFIRIG